MPQGVFREDGHSVGSCLGSYPIRVSTLDDQLFNRVGHLDVLKDAGATEVAGVVALFARRRFLDFAFFVLGGDRFAIKRFRIGWKSDLGDEFGVWPIRLLAVGTELADELAVDNAHKAIGDDVRIADPLHQLQDCGGTIFGGHLTENRDLRLY